MPWRRDGRDKLLAKTLRNSARIVLPLVHLALLCLSALWHSDVPDEPAHLVAGLSHWQLEDFSLFRVNPPLARMWATLPIYLFEPEQDPWLEMYRDPGEVGRTEFDVGNRFIRDEPARFHRLLVVARCTSALFSLMAMAVCFYWAKELYGEQAGWLAAWLWCFSPLVLGFGGILTPDVPSAATGVLALYMFWRWLRRNTWAEAYLAGVGLGLAELTKSTWIVLPPLMVGIWLLLLVFKRQARNTSAATSLLQLLLVFGLSLLVLNCGYGFQGTFQKLGDFHFQSSYFVSDSELATADSDNRFRGTWMENIPVPFPKQYVIGLDFQKAASKSGSQMAYLRGVLREDGWWYYYLYAIAVKCTLGGLTLFLAASVVRLFAFRRKSSVENLTVQNRSHEYVLWLPMLAVIVLLSLHTGLNRHSRYLLPIFPLAIVWASQSAMWQHRVAWWLVRGAAVAAAVSSLAVFPHSMSYFNEAVGGIKNGHLHLLNSNVDWGQDLYFLKHEMKRRGWSRIGLATGANHGAEHLGIDFFLPPLAPDNTLFEMAHEVTDPSLQPGNYAISVNFMHGYPRSCPDGKGGNVFIPRDGLSYFQEFEPIGMIGGSMCLYEISEHDIRKSKTWGAVKSNIESSIPPTHSGTPTDF
jgi:4-amino-4-deoxy-L-arabinose transferase-like glycosyltransferase